MDELSALSRRIRAKREEHRDFTRDMNRMLDAADAKMKEAQPVAETIVRGLHLDAMTMANDVRQFSNEMTAIAEDEKKNPTISPPPDDASKNSDGAGSSGNGADKGQ